MSMAQKDLLANELHNRMDHPEVQMVLELLEWRLQRVKERLVECLPVEFQKLQGEAVAYTTLIRDIRRPKPSIVKPE
jgi:hypothetical protein